MNIVKIYGGLGNQMFQYAFGKAVQKQGSSVSYDISWFNHPHIDRMFCLNKFNVNMSFSNFQGLQAVKENGFNIRIINEKDCVFFGYWQSPLFFKDFLPELKKELTVKEEFYTTEFVQLRERITSENSVALHIRRGDFLNHKRHHVISMEYYEKAIHLVKALREDTIFYVFSDDMKWCQENFKDVNFVHLEEYLDFELIRLCKHQIMPNSTFSLWATYLTDSDGLKIAPIQWDKKPEDQELRVITKQLLPEHFVILS